MTTQSRKLDIAEYGLKALAELVRLQDEANEATVCCELSELLLHFSSIVADAAEDLERLANLEAAKVELARREASRGATQDGSDADRLAKLDEAKAAVDERVQLEAIAFKLQHANDLDAVCAVLDDEPGADVTAAMLARLRAHADQIRDAVRKVA